MMTKRKKWFAAVFSVGIIAGAGFGLAKLKASPPDEASLGTATMFYDERWRAAESIVSTSTGFARVDMAAGGPVGQISGHYDATSGAITVAPKMLVTKWRVHGHIHQE